MKKVIIAVAFASFSAAALAGPCVALDYQEMKDMPAEDLSEQACKYRDARNSAFSQSIADIGRPGWSQGNSTAKTTQEECTGQLERISRVLKLREITEEDVQRNCATKETERLERVKRLRELNG